MGSLLSKKCSMACHWLIEILLADLERSHSGRTYSRSGSVYLRCPATIDTRAKHHASEGSWAIISTLTRSFEPFHKTPINRSEGPVTFPLRQDGLFGECVNLWVVSA